ncbi:MAG: PAS domain S-box protein [Bryobacterales bacterium]|nr:PAS domain S-box protein [Bryobacterales bacterium]
MPRDFARKPMFLPAAGLTLGDSDGWLHGTTASAGDGGFGLPSAEPVCLLLIVLSLAVAMASVVLLLRQRRRAAHAEGGLEVQRQLLMQHYQDLSCHANDLILLSDGAGRIWEANQRALSRYGYTREQMLRMKLRDLGVFDPPEVVLGLPFEAMHRDSTGASFPVEVCVRTVVAADRQFRQSIILDLTERKRAEAAVRESSQRFQTLTDLAPSGIFQTSGSGDLLYANHLMQDLAGLKSERTTGQNWFGAVHPDDRAAVQMKWQTCLRKGEPLFAEFRYRLADGRETPVVCHAAPLRSAAGEAEGYIGVVSDVSRIRQAELSEQRSAEMVRTIVEGAPAGIVAVDLEDRVILWNSASETLLGWTSTEVMGQPVRGIPAEALEDRSWQWATVRAGGAVRGAEVARVRQDGQQGVYSLSAAPMRDAAGAITGMISILVDITEKKAAERALQDTTALLRMSQKMARLGSWRITFPTWPCAPSEETWEWSDETYWLLGVDPGEFSPSWDGFLNLVHPEDVEIVRQHSKTALERGGRYHIDHRVVRPDGSILDVREYAELDLDPEGRPHRMTGTIQDISSYRELEDQLIQAQKLDSVARLAGGVAHDFNNLLTVILGFSELLADPALPPEDVIHHGMAIRRAATRAEYLVRQLLAFGRKQVLAMKSTDLNRVIQDSERMLLAVLGEDAQLITRLRPNLPPIWADPSQIEQVLVNLAANARDAMPTGGRLTIETIAVDVESGDDPAPGRYLELKVTDTGTGIDEQAMSHLFEPFFTTKSQGQGVGLGLASVYGIVRQSQGAVRVQSKVGVGTSFQILLPLTTSEAATREPRYSPDRVPAQGKTVLVVDDEEGIRRVVAMALRRRGFQVLEAEHAEEALAVSGRYADSIDLLFTDVVLPGMNGQELAEVLRGIRPGIGVLLCSGYPRGSRLEASLDQDPIEYLQKPFTNADLLAKVDATLRRISA